jgi:Fe-S-cluster formation regulator IscX/YfhJ
VEKTIRESLKSCDKLHKTLNMFKDNTTKIYEICNKISREKFIDLDKKQVMDLKQFEDNQKRCGERVKENLKVMMTEIQEILSKTYYEFYLQDREIQLVFFEYVQHIDQKIEESLKRAIKLSMVDLNKTINGDKKTNPTPIFRLSIVLNDEDVKVVFNPTTDYLQTKIQETLNGMVQNVADLRRMEIRMKEDRVSKINDMEKADREKEANEGRPGMRKNEVDYEAKKSLPEEIESRSLPTFDKAINADGDIPNLSKKIMDGVDNTCKQLPDFLQIWKKHTT